MSAFVSAAEAEQLYATGWRAERTLLDGPRIVWERHPDLYATIVPGPEETSDFYWSIWLKRTGDLVRSGQHPNPLVAAQQARTAMN